MTWCFLHDQFVGDGCNGCAKDRALGIRRAPRKLPNGQWSDGVDRTHRVFSNDYAEGNGRRVTVTRPNFVDDKFWAATHSHEKWVVCTGTRSNSWHASFEDAIVAADKLARSRR